MTYELAKELKDAGFPQTADYGGDEYGNEFNYHRDTPQPEHVRFPTLSELIEACGKHAQFKLSYKEALNKNWRAGVYDQGAIYGDGSTPEEAVAKLWIALHGHN